MILPDKIKIESDNILFYFSFALLILSLYICWCTNWFFIRKRYDGNTTKMYKKSWKQNIQLQWFLNFLEGFCSFVIFVECDSNLTVTDKLYIQLHVLNYLHQVTSRATELRYLLITDSKISRKPCYHKKLMRLNKVRYRTFVTRKRRK